MIATGIVRRTDNLGRVVIPKELRKTHGIDRDQELEIYVENGKIVIKKHSSCCMLCNNRNELLSYDSNLICYDCIDQMNKLI